MSDLERRLLAAGRTDGPTRAARAAASAAILGSVGLAPATGLAAIAAKVSQLGLGHWLVAGTLGTSVVVGGAWVHATPHHPEVATARVLARSSVPLPAPRLVEKAAQPVSVPVPIAPRPPASTPSHRTVDIEAEVQSLDLIRGQLQRGDASGALYTIHDHTRRFGRGALQDEIAVLRIEANLVAGHAAAGCRQGAAFMGQRPSSPYAARVRSLVRTCDSKIP